MSYTRYFDNKIIWITGASSGIGNALAKELAHSSATLIVSGRNTQSLIQLKDTLGDTVGLILPFDIQNNDDYAQAVQTIDTTYGKLDMVIFNAGVNNFLNIKEFSTKVYETLLSINFISVIKGIELSLPLLKKSNTPHIAATSSIAAYQGMYGSGPYCASKAALRTALQTLQIELYDTMPVSIISPGFVTTPLTDKNPFPMPFKITSDKAAKHILKGLSKQKKEICFPFLFTHFAKFMGSLPAGIQAWCGYIVSKKILP